MEGNLCHNLRDNRVDLARHNRGSVLHRRHSKSVGITTALCPYIGYQKAASIAKKSLKTGESVTSLVLKDELLTASSTTFSIRTL